MLHIHLVLGFVTVYNQMNEYRAFHIIFCLQERSACIPSIWFDQAKMQSTALKN